MNMLTRGIKSLAHQEMQLSMDCLAFFFFLLFFVCLFYLFVCSYFVPVLFVFVILTNFRCVYEGQVMEMREDPFVATDVFEVRSP